MRTSIPLMSTLLGILSVSAAHAAPSAAETRSLYEAFMAHLDVKVLTFDPAQDGCNKLKAFLKDANYAEFLKEVQEEKSGPALVASWLKQVCEDGRPLVITAMEKMEPPTAKDEKEEIDHDDRLQTRTKIDADVSGSAVTGNEKYFHFEGTLSATHAFNDKNIAGASASANFESDSEIKKESATVFYNHLLTSHWAVFATISVAHDNAKELKLGQELFTGVIYSKFPISELNRHYLAFSAALGERGNRMEREAPNTFTILAASYRAKFEQRIAPSIKFMADLWFQNAVFGPPGPGEESKVFDFSDNRILGHANLRFGKDDGLHFSVGYTFDRWNRPFLGAKKTDTLLEFGVGYGLWTRRRSTAPLLKAN